MPDNKTILDNLIKRRDKARGDAQRVKGRLDSARKEKEAVEEECRKKGVEPEKLDDSIRQLTSKFDSLVTDLTQQIKDAETSLIPYLEEP